MKTLGFLIVLLLGFNSLYAQDSKIIVESDKNLEADFSKYRTFQFAPQILDSQSSLFFLNDIILKESIIHAIEHELHSRGYESTAAKPDLVINFRVFEKPVQLSGYTDPQSGFWGNMPVREPGDKRTYDVKAGTLLLSMADRKTGRLVWQGFASGIMDNKIFDRKKERIDEAVSLLFNEFKQRADDLSRR